MAEIAQLFRPVARSPQWGRGHILPKSPNNASFTWPRSLARPALVAGAGARNYTIERGSPYLTRKGGGGSADPPSHRPAVTGVRRHAFCGKAHYRA